MIVEARQHYHLDIKRKLSTQDPVLERVAQDEDRTQTINLDDWTISFKEFQPKRSKQSKKQIGKASQEKMELPQPLADRSVQPSSNQLQPEVVQPPYDNSIKKNPGAQAIPPKVEMQHKGNRDGRIKRVLCYKCGEKATMPIDVPQSEEARMGLLKECVLTVVKKGTMPIVVQQSVRGLGPIILDYIVSSAEKMDTLPVGVKKMKNDN